MTDFLVFSIYAPLASWGDIAVGEVRGSWNSPSRSAILGFVAAALGLEREQQEFHDALDAGYGVAIWANATGAPLSDYHTAQTVAASVVRKRRPATRAQLLSAGERETILSRRAYRQDAMATIAIWARPRARWPLTDLASALRRPAFTLYAGRKSNVLGLPLSPEVVSVRTLADALASRWTDDQARAVVRLPSPAAGWGQIVEHDPCDGFASGLQATAVAVRRDAQPRRNQQWLFAERMIHISTLSPVIGDSAALGESS